MELYRGLSGHRPSFVIILFIVLFVLCNFVSAAPSVVYRRISDECDWFGSGLENTESTSIGVQPVYLRCREGSIQWEYPRGALRVLLRLGHSNKEFQGCLRVASNSSGANLYLEGHHKLQILYKHDTSQPENHQQCFRSSGGQVALFLEAQGSADSLKKDVFTFMYDLQPIQLESFSECRPCTDRELIYSFCTSDFVVRGSISSIYQNELMHRTELVIRGRQILRDSEPKVFKLSPETNHNKTVQIGVVYRPLHCGTKAGFGEFLFLGRWRLGDPILRCAPRWIEWKKVRRRAAFSENVDCVLE